MYKNVLSHAKKKKVFLALKMLINFLMCSADHMFARVKGGTV